jgi:hypothetical protein
VGRGARSTSLGHMAPLPQVMDGSVQRHHLWTVPGGRQDPYLGGTCPASLTPNQSGVSTTRPWGRAISDVEDFL